MNTTVTFSYSGFGEDDVGKWQYKLNVTDFISGIAGYDSWVYNETPINNFTLQPDDINLTYVAGNNSVVNRSIAPSISSAVLSVMIYDINRNTVLSGGVGGSAKFYVTTDPYNSNSFILDKSGVVVSGTPGFVNETFPTSIPCSYGIGPLRWRVEYSGSAYKDTNSSDFYLNMTTYPLQVNILGPNNQTFRKNLDSIPYAGNVSDDCSGVSGAAITFQGLPSAPWTSCSGASVTDSGNGTYNCSVVSSIAASPTRYNLTMNATKQYYNSSATANKVDSFWIVTNPQLSGESVTTNDQSSSHPYSWGAI